MRKNIILGALFVLVISTQAFGLNIPFGDSTIYWNGYPSFGPGSSNGPDNYRDFIGSPNFTGGAATIVGGMLTGLRFDYWMDGDTYVKPTDLFIDKGADGTWDYLVRIYGTDLKGADGDYNLYSIINNHEGYINSNEAWLSGWSNVPNPSNFNIRDNHPVAMKNISNSPMGPTILFSGWQVSAGDHFSSFDFGNGLDLGNQDFIFSWTLNCANDVIMERVNVPEPGTMLLLGFGLVSLVGMGRLRKKN